MPRCSTSLIATALLFCGCGSPPRNSVDAGDSADVESAPDVAVVDAGGPDVPTDAGLVPDIVSDVDSDSTPDIFDVPGDADATDDSPDGGSYLPEEGEWTLAEMESGAIVEGELVAIYDHSVWWSWPEDELTYGLFDESRFAEFPDDRSLRLVHGSQVSRFEGEPMGERRRYRDVLRDRAMTLETAPLDGRFYVITGHDTYHLEENGFGDYAWDLVRTGADGLTYRGAGTSNEDYFVWGAPVRLPATGVVTEIRDSAPDNVPGILAPVSEEPDCGENNCLGVHLGGGFYLYLLHLRQGSVPDAIQLGDTLSAGTLIGEVGNSGVSLAPHLHVALLWYDAAASTPRSWSVPVEMENIWWSSESSGATQAEYLNPTAGTWLSAEEF